MRRISLLVTILICRQLTAQPLNDSLPKLIQQKDNVITENTIIQIENLGPNINSDLPELRPTISPDGNLLFFVTENHPRNTKFNSVPNSQDIWVAERDTLTGTWGEAHHLPYPLNKSHYNAVYWLCSIPPVCQGSL